MAASQGDGNTCKKCRYVWPTTIERCPRDGMSLVPQPPQPSRLTKAGWREAFREQV